MTNDTRARTRRPADPPTSFLLSYSHCHHRRHRIVLQAPGSSQRSLPYQIVGVVILRCPLFVAVGRLRTVPTIIPVSLDNKSNPLPPTRPLDHSIVSLPLRRLPHRQYNDSARTVLPVHLLGRPIIPAGAFRRPLSTKLTVHSSGLSYFRATR